jgi:serine/threonine protein phosphatase PrpC
VGDSRGVLCRGEGRAVGITQDHKPELEAEKKRIEVRAEIATSEIATSEIATSEITAHVSISARCTHDLGEVGS